jgi:hypothetical protein
MSTPSYFLEELASKMIIPRDFINSIVIAVEDNYEVEIPDKRMLDILAKQIAGIVNTYKIPYMKNIYFFNEILFPNYENRLNESDLMYDKFLKNIYYDKVFFLNVLKKYI